MIKSSYYRLYKWEYEYEAEHAQEENHSKQQIVKEVSNDVHILHLVVNGLSDFNLEVG